MNALPFAAVCGPAVLLWAIPPVRRWTLRWPLLLLMLAGALLIGGAVLLSWTSLDVYLWSPVILAGFALEAICGAALVVRAFEWYLWAYWR
jgi:hypothetical protein